MNLFEAVAELERRLLAAEQERDAAVGFRKDAEAAYHATLAERDEAVRLLRKLLPHTDLGDVGLFTYGPFAVEQVASAADVKAARAFLSTLPPAPAPEDAGPTLSGGNNAEPA